MVFDTWFSIPGFRYLNRLCLGIRSDISVNKACICLFIDLEKAFDSIWKRGLIVKLKKMGIRGNVLNLIDHFLTSRKVALKVNGSKGNARDGADVGVPQGSVLSPILFKIFMMDFLEELTSRKDIVLYKFADDGTIKISANSTKNCLDTLQIVMKAVNNWAFKWRMVINCDPNKTEVICFHTAENDRRLIPLQYKLGDKTVKLVSQTKVLGLIIDEDLTFSQHAEMIYNKLVAKWVLICNSCNRQWGFTQRIMVQLLRTLFLSTLLYGSHIWMSRNNMKEINKLYYKMIKSTVGAVFNVKHSICELIVGIPPIHIQNTVNQLKHYLKVIINRSPASKVHKVTHLI